MHARDGLLRREQFFVAFELGLLGEGLALGALGGYDAQFLLEAFEFLRFGGIEAGLFGVAVSFAFQV